MKIFRGKYPPKVLFWIILLCASGGPLCLSTQGYYDKPLREETSILKTRVRHWFASSSTIFRTSFFTPAYFWTPPTDRIKGGSTLDFKGMETAMDLFSAELRPLPWFSVELEGGDNRFTNGKSFDHDWLHCTDCTITFLYDGTVWNRPDHRDFSESRARTSGSSRLYSVNAYFRIYRNSPKSIIEGYEMQHSLDVYAGYSRQEDNIRITDGVQILATDFFIPTPPVGPFSGLNSTFNTEWWGWRFGFREQARLSKKVSLEGKFAFGPSLAYKGEGTWNLRPDFAKPSFRQTAIARVIEVSASAEWNFWKAFKLEGGYLGWFHNATNGLSRTFFSDGTQSEIKLEKAGNSHSGLFAALSWKY